MNPRIALLFAVFLAASSAADAQKNVRLRGTITAFDGNVLAVKTIDGNQVMLRMTGKTGVAAAKAITLADLKPGSYVGSTTVPGHDGRLLAREVHTIGRNVPAGHIKWDHPGTMMTNANVVSIAKLAEGDELTVAYKGGSQKILVPPSTPVVTTVAGDRSLLKPGEYVFVVARVDADGKMTALRIQVSKSGVKPPQ